jgi:hypothetical protein
MAKVFIEESTLTAIGDAIRSKTSTTAKLSPTAMPAKIKSIETGGGGGYEPTDAELKLTGDMTMAFASNKFDWIIREYGDRIYMHDCRVLTKMFYNNTNLTEIPFVLRASNAVNNHDMSELFNGCEALTTLPATAQWKPLKTSKIFYGCYMLREIPDSFVDAIDWTQLELQTSAYTTNCSQMFQLCKSLRKIPMEMIHFANANVSFTYHPYYQGFYYCTTADEITNVPVDSHTLSGSVSVLRNTFLECNRAKEITFAPFDGTVNWSNQFIDLTSGVGYCSGNISDRITGYNSGITRDKEVTDDASYQALKDDPDWFTCSLDYCRYNHDSAVNTINSLPTTTGDSCVIQFWRKSGSKTDGGAIETLTDAEIAVAAAKGWTVSYYD